MGTALFVRNLSEDIDSSELTSLFEAVGEVMSSSVRMDMVRGVERRVGFVQMATAQQALDGIDRFHGFRTHGEVLVVTSDQPHIPVIRPSTKKSKAKAK